MTGIFSARCAGSPRRTRMCRALRPGAIARTVPAAPASVRAAADRAESAQAEGVQLDEALRIRLVIQAFIVLER